MSDPAATEWKRFALRWGPVAACAVILIIHSLRFDFVTDDAYISFVFSRNLAHHGELSFNLGHPVEGYTNFLWTVLLAGGMVLGVAPELSSRVLGTGFGVATLFVVFRLTERALGRRDGTFANPWAYLPPLLLALSSGFACWCSGGLETQLFTFLVTLAIDRYVSADLSPRRLAGVGAVLALAAMTRPEALMVMGLLCFHARVLAAIRLRRGWWRLVPTVDELLCWGTFLLVWAPWFAWRWRYYGWMFPNTYYVKATGATTATYDRLLRDSGYHYVWAWLTQTGVVWMAPIVAASAAVWKLRTPRFTLVTFTLPFAAVYLAYTISVGGDFMGLHRFIMPVFVIAAIAIALGLETFASLVPRGGHVAGAAVTAVIAVAFAVSQARLDERSLHPKNAAEMSEHGIDSPAYLMAYTENRAAIGRAMHGCFDEHDFSIVGGAGAQPYLADMRGIDLFGLVSERIAHEVAPDNPRPGHNKRGPDALLAQYDPDFVFHCYAISSSPTVGPLGCGGFWKARGFVQRTIRVAGLDGKRELRDDTPGAGPVADYYTFLVKPERDSTCGSE